MRFARPWMILSALVVAATFASPVASAEEVVLSPDGTAYLIVSIPDQFTADFDRANPAGSSTIFVPIGTFTGGGDVLDSVFVATTVEPFALPGGVTLDDLNGNQMTVIGTFMDADGVMHVVSPEFDDPLNPDDGIPADLQAAVFHATQSGALNALGNYPSTVEVVETIAGFLPEGSPVTTSDVFFHVFGFTEPLTIESGIVTSEGDLFPHEPHSALYNFEVALSSPEKKKLAVETDVCRLVGIDVKPGNADNKINFTSDVGTLKVAILSSAGFDATEVDGTTAQIGGVFATSAKVTDADHDGLDDLVVMFPMSGLNGTGVVDCHTTSLTVHAEMIDGSCIEGTDAVVATEDCEAETN